MADRRRTAGIVVALALLLGALAWWWLGGTHPDASDAPPPEARRTAPDGEPSSAAGVGPHLAPRGPGSGTEETEAPQAPRGHPPEGTVPVTVVDGAGSGEPPIAGAGIRAPALAGGVAAADTGPDGVGHLRLPPATPCAVWVWTPEPDPRIRYLPRAAFGPEGLRIVVPAAGRVRVRLLESGTGREILQEELEDEANVAAEILPESASGLGEMADLLMSLMVPEDRTRWGTRLAWDAEGAYLRERPGEGAWRLSLRLPDGRVAASPTFSLRPGEDGQVEVTVPRADVRRRIRVLDGATRAPLPDARARLVYETGSGGAFLSAAELAADEHGEIDLPEAILLPATRLPLWWITTGRHAARLPTADLPPADRRTVTDVLVWETATVEGTAYGADGLPAAGALVLQAEGGRTSRTRVGPDGRFRLEGVVVPRSGGGRVPLLLVEDVATAKFTMVGAQVAAGERTEIVIGKPKSATTGVLRGRITAGGRPAPGLLLFARAASPSGSAATAPTDPEGRYEFAGLVGKVEIRVFLTDPQITSAFYAAREESLEIRAGEERTLDLDLPGGAVLVRILDSPTGVPIRGAFAGAVPRHEEGEPRPTFPGWEVILGSAVTTGPDGTALLRFLPLGGEVRVHGSARGYRERIEQGIRPGTLDSPAEVELRLEKAP